MGPISIFDATLFISLAFCAGAMTATLTKGIKRIGVIWMCTAFIACIIISLYFMVKSTNAFITDVSYIAIEGNINNFGRIMSTILALGGTAAVALVSGFGGFVFTKLVDYLQCKSERTESASIPQEEA